MTVLLLHDYCELEERTSHNLKAWKVSHTTIYILAVVFGIMNYTFLHNTKDLVDGNCVLNPRKLEFHWVERTNNVTDEETNSARRDTPENDGGVDVKTVNINVTDANATNAQENDSRVRSIRNIEEFTESTNVNTLESSNNATLLYGNETHRLALDVTRTLFAKDGECTFPEYMPLLATVFASVWATLFLVCPAGGRSRGGLTQPWRILAPALLFAIVMVGLTGHSFVKTNGGLQSFCASFYNYTNATTCSSVDPLLEEMSGKAWSAGVRVAATRAASAGVWALWAVAAALLLARCLAAPDFTVKRTGVFLIDPKQKLVSQLPKSARQSQRSSNSSPNKRDTASVKSEPTILTELVTASVEHEPQSEPTSSISTPVKMKTSPSKKDVEDGLEMTCRSMRAEDR